MNEFLENNITNIVEYAKKNKIGGSKFLRTDVIIAGDWNESIYQLLGTIIVFQNTAKNLQIHLIADNISKDIIEEIYQSKHKVKDREEEQAGVLYHFSIDDYIEKRQSDANQKAILFFGANIEDNKYVSYEKQYRLETMLSEYIDKLAGMLSLRVAMVAFLPALEVCKQTEYKFAEREYEAYVLEKYTAMEKETLVSRLEDILRRKLKNLDISVKSIRISNVFGPGISDTSKVKFNQWISEIENTRKLIIKKNTRNVWFSICHVEAAIEAILHVLMKGKKGNVYQVAQYETTEYTFLFKISEVFGEYYDFDIDIVNDEISKTGNALLATDKIINIGWKALQKINNDILLTSMYCMSMQYNGDYIENRKYRNKLNLIKKLELEALDEIKRICDKHSIKYFLVGGSLLGAVRHKGFIPWDDDLDIGMLREDFEKFRKVCPEELDKRYAYQSYRNEPNSHYIFDKVRLKNTFFTTQFSQRFKIENGIFIDILVYDKTSNFPRIQKIHIRLLEIWKRAINVRWVNAPRKNVHYRLTKVLLPIMREVPFDWYHKCFEIILRMFNKRKNTEYLIDGVGMNLRKGAFPAKWFDNLMDVPFEDRTFPIPAEYDEYLKHWYGEKYMNLLPIAKRNSGHVMKRIDLGEWILNNSHGKFREADFRGELYEESVD